MPLSSYFAGFLGNAVANAFVQVGLVVVLGHLLFDVSWPRDWVELIVFTAVGVLTFGSLGIALSQAIPNFDSAAAYVNIVFLPAIFISGVFYSSDSLPAGPGRGRPGAAAQARDRRLQRRDRDRPEPGRQRRRAGHRGAVGRSAGIVLAVRNFRWE